MARSTTRSTPPPSERRLSEVARQLVIPEGIETSVFPKVQRRLLDVGVEFDCWQRGFGTLALSCRSDGKFAATIGGVVASIPRQVGKTFTVGNLLIGLALEFPCLKVAWTSHHNRTTTNTFRSMQGMVRRKAVFPHLAPGVNNGIRSANGEQEIRFRNGSIIMFGAREQGFGRGLDEIDFVVYDEAQILTLKALEDMIPATNQARNPHGALIFFLGTPPRPTDPGEAFSVKREQALSGSATNMVYVEIGADPDADPDDRSQWPKMNPSYPHRTPLESMLRMRANITDDDAYRREAMGIWPAVGSGLISPQEWAALTDSRSTPQDPVSFGLYVGRSGSAAIGVAGYRADGKIHVGVIPAVSGRSDVTSLPGTKWIAPRIQELHGKWNPCAVVVDEKSEAGALIEDIQALGVQVEKTTATTMANACVRFLAAVNDGELRHRGAVDLQASVCSGKPRDLLDSWAWDRKDRSSDITQLVAVTLALHGLMVNGRPTRSAYEDEDLFIV